jgi:hypothetical protein
MDAIWVWVASVLIFMGLVLVACWVVDWAWRDWPDW